MKEKHIKIFNDTEDLYASKTPVSVSEKKLFKDIEEGTAFAQIKLQNLSRETVSSVKVRITPLDSVLEELGDAFIFEYVNLTVLVNEEFVAKEPFLFPHPATRFYRAEVCYVKYESGAEWTSVSCNIGNAKTVTIAEIDQKAVTFSKNKVKVQNDEDLEKAKAAFQKYEKTNRKKKGKKRFALLLVLCLAVLLAGYFVISSSQENTADRYITAAPITGGDTLVTVISRVTLAPNVTVVWPEITGMPLVTQTPETTLTPDTTKVPATTKVPDSTKVPVATTTPETTRAPDTTEPPHVHTYGEWSVVDEPSCTEDGSKERICACGERETQSIDATGHSYIAKESQPTCREPGYTTHTCACGESYIDGYISPSHTDENADNICDACGQTVSLSPGLYDESNNLIASWDELVNTYGMRVDKNYQQSSARTAKTSPYYLLHNVSALENGVKFVLGDMTFIGDYAFYDCTSVKSITIPDGVKSIGQNAFESCVNLAELSVPSGVTSIGQNAFSFCTSLASITIPDGVTSIGSCTFNFCQSLTSITIPNGVTSIGMQAFAYCSNLIDITIPDGVTVIQNYTFQGCTSLSRITLGDRVTSIKIGSFRNCNALTSVYYGGTAASWQKVAIESENTSFTDATRYDYSETKPTGNGNYWHYVDGLPTVWESDAHSHSYESVVTEPTCREQGYTTYTCACGESYVDSYTEPQHRDENGDGTCDKCGDSITLLLGL